MRKRHFLASSLVAAVAAFASGTTGSADDASPNLSWANSPTRPIIEFANHDPSQGGSNSTHQIELASQAQFANSQFTNNGPPVQFTSLGSDAGYDAGCNDCGPTRVIIGGAEATFLWADVNGTAGTVDTFDAFDAPAGSFSTAGTAVDQMYTAPRVWLGVRGDRWGVVGRFWDYRVGNGASDPLLALPDTVGFTSTNNLRAYTMDIEATRKYCYRGWNGNLFLGARHALLDSTASISTITNVGGDLLTGLATTDRQFTGTGLTYGLSGARPVRCDSPLSLFWNVRGSLLWGNNAATTTAATSILTGIGAAAADIQFATASTDTDEVYIIETQAGVKWEHELKCMPASAFFKIAGEYQYWDSQANLGAASTSASFAIPGAAVTASASAGAQQVDLFGFTVGAGFTR